MRIQILIFGFKGLREVSCFVEVIINWQKHHLIVKQATRVALLVHHQSSPINDCIFLHDVFNHHKLSIKWCDAYTRVALIWERRLFQLWVKSEVSTRYAQFIIKYVNVPQTVIMNLVSRVSLHWHLSTHKLLEVLFLWHLFISSTVTKVGCKFVNTQISTTALVCQRPLFKILAVKVWCLFESSVYLSGGA